MRASGPLIPRRRTRGRKWGSLVAVAVILVALLLWSGSRRPQRSPADMNEASSHIPAHAVAVKLRRPLPLLSPTKVPNGIDVVSVAPLAFQPVHGNLPWPDIAMWLSGGPKDKRAGSGPRAGMTRERQDELAAFEERHNASLTILRSHRAEAASAYRVLGHAGAALVRRSLPTVASVFYPFGGPDIASAMSFFPGASQYLLVGKNPAAGSSLESLSNLNSSTFAGSLDAVAALLQRSDAGQFMRQQGMEPFGEGQLGVGMMAPLLAGVGGTGDLRVSGVELLPDRSPSDGIRSGAALDCALVDFRGGRIGQHVAGQKEPMRRLKSRVEYVQADLLSHSGCREVLAHASLLQRPVALMLKAAAYLLFEASPSAQACLRALTVELGADVLLQDDSGIPLTWLMPSSTDGSAVAAAGDETGQVVPGWHVKPFGGYAAGPAAAPYEQPLLQRVFDEGPHNSPWPLGPLRYGYCLPYTSQEELKTLERQGAVADAAARDTAAAKQKHMRYNNQTSVDGGEVATSLDGGVAGRKDEVREPSSGAGGGSIALRQREVCNLIVATRLHGGLTRSEMPSRASGKRGHRLRGAVGSSSRASPP